MIRAKVPKAPRFPDVDMITMSKAHIWFNDPQKSEILVEDLILGLAELKRYNSTIPWTIGQHLAMCVELTQTTHPNPESYIGYVAIHDIHEVYTNDLPSGIKKYCLGYKAVESIWEEAMLDFYNLDPESDAIAAIVKTIDEFTLLAEMEYHNHPGYETVAWRIGRWANSIEMAAIERVAALTQEECWQKVHCAIVQTSEYQRINNGN